ncbi:hypothetical protein CBM2589_B10264 [Cupriavidus taiwanensis]|uniref:Uncharacterized protein n=1 Tax=Cupriavidus taiwanensis TaxID=164546 RepID=A0A975WNQ7_9BURK|nr:hypothetical protein CBM2589_B10264 [Cupriavidus taiwanensis]
MRADCLLPSPARGRGAGGEGRSFYEVTRCRLCQAPALSPTPLPQAGEGSLLQAMLVLPRPPKSVPYSPPWSPPPSASTRN